MAPALHPAPDDIAIFSRYSGRGTLTAVTWLHLHFSFHQLSTARSTALPPKGAAYDTMAATTLCIVRADTAIRQADGGTLWRINSS